jgi:hypothetical protein
MDIEDKSLWRRLALVVAFFTLTPVVLLASLISLISISPSTVVKAKKPINTTAQSKIGISVYASLPANVPSISGKIGVADARPEIIKQYLAYFDSPLTAYSEEIVQMADKYGIDYRYIPAIAQQESNLCHVIPTGSYNCWGWGITSVSSLGFDSYSEGIETVTKGLKENYIDEGLTTPASIMTKYTPQSNGSWAHGVSEFMSLMK